MLKGLIAAALIVLAILTASNSCGRQETGIGQEEQGVLQSLLTGRQLPPEKTRQPQPKPSGTKTSHVCAANNWTPSTGDRFQATVTRVVDGDTLEALAQGQEITIRLWGIDAPETDQPKGLQAKLTLKQLTPEDRTVTVHAHGLDKYGRILAVLETDADLAVNARLVESGTAYHYRYGPAQGNTCLTWMESFARSHRQGVWQADPQGGTRPWEHRRKEAEEG